MTHTHGHKSGGKPTRTYSTWANMLQRCENPKHTYFDNYGGRGITICERWHEFKNFLEDVGEVPDGMSIERIDNDGDYQPGNVRWVDRRQQANNRRTNNRISFNGETKTIAEWSRETAIDQTTLWQRLFNYGWSVEKALTIPVPEKGSPITFNDKTQTVMDWSRERGIPSKTIRYRLAQGWPVENVLSKEKQYNGMKGMPRPR